jgi:hypothetical protein
MNSLFYVNCSFAVEIEKKIQEENQQKKCIRRKSEMVRRKKKIYTQTELLIVEIILIKIIIE